MKIPIKEYWQLLVKYLKPQWFRVLALTILLFTGIGLQLVNPQIMRTFIDAVTRMADTAAGKTQISVDVKNAALLFVGLALVQQIVSTSASFLSAIVGWTSTNALRNDLARHCLYLDMSFHNAHKPGEMIERLDGDVASLTDFFSQFVISLAGSVILLFGVLVMLYREDWRVGVAFSIFTAVALGVMMKFRNIAVPHWRAVREASAELFGFLEERLAGTEDIRANGARSYVMRRFFQLMRPLYQKSLKAGWAMNIMVNTGELSFAIGNAVAFALGAWLYLRGLTSIGTAYIISYYSGMLMHPIGRITRQLEQLQRATAGITRIKDLFAVKTRIDVNANQDINLGSGPYEVRFDNVSFGYDDAVPQLDAQSPSADDSTGKNKNEEEDDVHVKQTVLHNLTFEIQPGKILGLLGRTGSGKTTMTRLLFRLYDPDEGEIQLGGHSDQVACSIGKLPLMELRRRIGMVTQNIQLFNATVRDNLTFFDTSISDDRILAVIENLKLGNWFHALSDGLDTELESGGSGLSAGEQQLLAFTRIFLQDPGLVILDEASSRLDPATEYLIERAVDQLVENRTALIIAHRLTTVQRADDIMILDDGCILEYGSRQELVQNPDSHFSHLLKTGLEKVLV